MIYRAIDSEELENKAEKLHDRLRNSTKLPTDLSLYTYAYSKFAADSTKTVLSSRDSTITIELNDVTE